jgi:hypothetical protein
MHAVAPTHDHEPQMQHHPEVFPTTPEILHVIGPVCATAEPTNASSRASIDGTRIVSLL